MFFLLLLALSAFGQEPDRWKGLIIDETSPQQAVALLGKPTTDRTSKYSNMWIQRLLSLKTEESKFRTMTWSRLPETTLTLTFTNERLVAIDRSANDIAAEALLKELGGSWRLQRKDPATDFEDWDRPRNPASQTVRTQTDDIWSMGYGLLAKSSKTFAIVSVIPTPDDMSKTSVTEGGPYWGKALLMMIVSRSLERSSGESDANDGPVPKGTETVMAPRSSITAETSTGIITITAGNGLLRSYTWEGATRSVEMGARRQRWMGSLGIAFPGPGDHWKEHNGITRGVLEEGQMRFTTSAAALKWLEDLGSWLPLVYRNDGLVVGFGKNLSRRQLNVQVWQIYINGKKPTKLTGANDDKVRVTLP